MSAKQRKRDAAGKVRALASEVGVEYNGRNPDMSISAFEELHLKVVGAASTPDQRERARAAKALFDGEEEEEEGTRRQVLPPSTALPSLPALVARSEENVADEGQEDDKHAFRLRSSACLFTWNNLAFARHAQEDLWQQFLMFLRALNFVFRWTATLEQSLKSLEQGRLHLHAFVEFEKAPDWTSLDVMKFMGGSPNA